MRLPPTIRTGQIALVNYRRHLHAIMACNTVETTLVALAVSEQRFLGPVAYFDAPVLANNVVALLLQLSLQQRVHRLPDLYCRFQPHASCVGSFGDFTQESEEARFRTHHLKVSGR